MTEEIVEITREIVSLAAQAEALPRKPGVYLFIDRFDRVIYVGKAKVLRERVASYFRSPAPEPEKSKRLMRYGRTIDFIITANELEALLLESTLIKKHQPRYNVLLKDSKGYPYIRITAEDFPRLELARRVDQPDARYFGPFSSTSAVRDTLRFLRRTFPMRHCREMKKQPCLYNHLDKCPGPCSGNLSKADYAQNVKSVVMFLEGRSANVIREMRKEMERAASNLQFEKAALLRDRAHALEMIASQRQAVMPGDKVDRDIIAIALEGEIACAEIMFVRDGALSGHDPFILSIVPGQTAAEALAGFLTLYYDRPGIAPREILLSDEPSDRALVEEFVRSHAGRKVIIAVPKRGEKLSLIENARTNAKKRLADEIVRTTADREYRIAATAAITNRVGAPKLLRRIVAFDISTIQGTSTVGAAITFFEAKPYRDGYRKFIIKGSGRDDFSSMSEMAERYFRRIAEGKEIGPDLVIVDGGRGQVSAVMAGIEKAGVTPPRVIGFAKHSGISHFGDGSQPIVFSPEEPATALVLSIIDEVHRFAITFHRHKRSKKMLES